MLAPLNEPRQILSRTGAFGSLICPPCDCTLFSLAVCMLERCFPRLGYSICTSLQVEHFLLNPCRYSCPTVAMPSTYMPLAPLLHCSGNPTDRVMIHIWEPQEFHSWQQYARAHLPLRAARRPLPMMSIMPGLPKPAVSQLACIGGLAWCRRAHSLSKPGRPSGSRLCNMWLTRAWLCCLFWWLVTVCPCRSMRPHLQGYFAHLQGTHESSQSYHFKVQLHLAYLRAMKQSHI